MHVDKHGQGVQAERSMEVDSETIERTRDVMFLRLAADGMSSRAIAELFWTNHRRVCRRLKRIPPHVREHYEKHPLVGLG